MGRTKMLVSLEILRERLELPSDVEIVVVKPHDGGRAELTIDGPGVPDADLVDAIYVRRPLFDRFEIVDP